MTSVLLIAGRSGVGKSTVSYEVSEMLRQHDIAHVLVDGDNLDAVHPPVEGSSLAEANLRAIRGNYRALGHHRMIYVNTVSVLESTMIRRAVGEDAEITGILLTATDDTATERLQSRGLGSILDVHVERSAAAATMLDDAAPAWVQRVPTDSRSVSEIATAILHLTGWLDGWVGAQAAHGVPHRPEGRGDIDESALCAVGGLNGRRQVAMRGGAASGIRIMSRSPGALRAGVSGATERDPGWIFLAGARDAPCRPTVPPTDRRVRRCGGAVRTRTAASSAR